MSKTASSTSKPKQSGPTLPATDSRLARLCTGSWRWFCLSIRHAFFLSILGGTVYLVLSLGGFWQQQLLVSSQRKNLEHLSNEQVPSAMRELADQGITALPELVIAMGSQRASVAIAAQQTVLDELDGFDHLPEQKSAQAKLALAKALAVEVTEFGPTTTRLSAYIAERLLREDFSAISSADRASLIDACGQVMRYATRQVDLSYVDGSQDANWDETPRPLPWEQTLKLIAEEKKAAQRSQQAQLETSLASSSEAGGIVPEGVDVPSLPSSALNSNNRINGGSGSAEDSNSAADLTTPRGLPDPLGENVPPPTTEPDNFHKPLRLRRLPRQRISNSKENKDEADPSLAREDANQQGTLTPLESEARQQLPTRPKQGGASPDGPPRDETVIRLLQDLVAADQQAANRAASALGQRGISTQHLELAKRLADPDPAVRKSLIEVLPRTSGLNARPWLMWLARDENADVRLAAMNMICTGQDAQLHAEIETLARGDRDERIVELAKHLAERRQKRR